MTLVKRLVAAFGAAALVWSAAVLAAEAGFVAGLNDVPLMPGLTPLGETLVFDKPGGRIAEAVFTSRASADAVSRFYAETLPQLGWLAGRAGLYVRENEELSLHVSGAAAATLRLVVQPRHK